MAALNPVHNEVPIIKYDAHGQRDLIGRIVERSELFQITLSEVAWRLIYGDNRNLRPQGNLVDLTFDPVDGVLVVTPLPAIPSVEEFRAKDSSEPKELDAKVPESNLVRHARTELGRIEGEQSSYVDQVCEIVQKFADMGHSGFSAAHCVEQLYKLLKFENLQPLTDDPNEWQDHSDISGTPLWQNLRNSAAFSIDGGTSYYLVNEMHQNEPTIYKSENA